MDWNWRETPICFQNMPDPVFSIDIHGSPLPVVVLPEEMLSKRLRGQNVRIYAPLGFMLPPGNMKAIPAGYMIRKGLENGSLHLGSTLLEGTSGGFGAALAYHAHESGIKVMALVSDALPSGKRRALIHQGAVVVTESEALKALGLERSPGSVKLAVRYAGHIGAVCLNQYANPLNPESYQELLARPLWDGIGGEVSLFVVSVGSRGILLGLGRAFRSWNPNIKIVGTNPYLGQNIDGTRDGERQRELKHSLKPLKPYLLERIDEATARAVSRRLHAHGIPAGPSAGAGFGSAEHMLLNKLEKGKLDAMRAKDGTVRVIVPLHDTRFPYDY